MPTSDNVNGAWKKLKKSYSNVSGAWKQDKKLFDNINAAWKSSYTSSVDYSSTFSFMYTGSAMDGTTFSFNVSGSTPGFSATITFVEPITITDAHFYMQRQNADIDVYFSGYMVMRDSGGTDVFTINADEDQSVGKTSSTVANPTPNTKIKTIYIHASGDSAVHEFYFYPYITVAGVSNQLGRSGTVQV